MYFDTVPAISPTFVYYNYGGKKSQWGREEEEDFVKRKSWVIWLGWGYLNVVIMLSLPDDTAVLWDRLVITLDIAMQNCSSRMLEVFIR